MTKHRKRTIIAVFVAVTLGSALVIATILLNDDDANSAALNARAQFSVTGTDGMLRTYTDVELGLPEVIGSQLEELHPWTRFATPEERLGNIDDELEQFHSLRGHDRERRFFEIQLQTVITDGLESLSGDLDIYNGTLALAFQEGMQECATRHSTVGDSQVFLSVDFETDYSEFEEQYGVTHDELVALRHSCAITASEYPTLAESVRMNMLEERHNAVSKYVYQWVRNNPELIVAVEYHPGMNQPYADALIESCKLAENPAICADEAGVTIEGD